MKEVRGEVDIYPVSPENLSKELCSITQSTESDGQFWSFCSECSQRPQACVNIVELMFF